MSYQNCWLYSNGVFIFGFMVIVIESVFDSNVEYSMYFDNFKWIFEGMFYMLLGLVLFKEGFDVISGNYQVEIY